MLTNAQGTLTEYMRHSFKNPLLEQDHISENTEIRTMDLKSSALRLDVALEWALQEQLRVLNPKPAKEDSPFICEATCQVKARLNGFENGDMSHHWHKNMELIRVFFGVFEEVFRSLYKLEPFFSFLIPDHLLTP